MTTTTTATTTILGFGSLLSERSARSSFPSLTDFRLVCIPNNNNDDDNGDGGDEVEFQYKRVFSHPSSFFFKTGIARTETAELSSLSCDVYRRRTTTDASGSTTADRGAHDDDYQKHSDYGYFSSDEDEETTSATAGSNSNNTRSGTKTKSASASSPSSSSSSSYILLSAFEIPESEVPAFYRREATYVIRQVAFRELDVDALAKAVVASAFASASSSENTTPLATRFFPRTKTEVTETGVDRGDRFGLLCCSATDAHYIQRWGQEQFDREYIGRGLTSMWKYPETTKTSSTTLPGVLYPTRCYLRHCLLSAIFWDEERLPRLLLPKVTDLLLVAHQKVDVKEEKVPDNNDDDGEKLTLDLIRRELKNVVQIGRGGVGGGGGLSVFENFLDATFLYDRCTTLRSYLRQQEKEEQEKIDSTDDMVISDLDVVTEADEKKERRQGGGTHRQDRYRHDRTIAIADVLAEPVPDVLVERYNGG